MTELNFIAEINFKENSKNALFCNVDTDFEQQISKRVQNLNLDGDDNYLGYIPLAFHDDIKTQQNVIDEITSKCYRSFHDGITAVKNGIRIYYRACHDGDKDFFQAWFNADKTIEQIYISIDNYDETTVEELGKNYDIVISER